MAKEDKENTTFHAKHGTICYEKMHFGLKNTRATYQRLVDKSFSKQLGDNVEIYVDDMVIKIKNEGSLMVDIKETFCTLCHINMELNPKKSIIGVETGQLLDHMIISEGTEANPHKVKPIIYMVSPRTITEVQSLNGKLVVIAEEAFQELKSHLKSLPALIVPTPGEKLILYLAATHEAISYVLMTERDHIQKSIYFLSKALQGPEVNYSDLEKLALALVTIKPENLRRLAKWSIEPGEHDIKYKPRTSVKGQILVDFVVESTINGVQDIASSIPQRPTNLTSHTWTLYTYGASSNDGSGACLILTDPHGNEVTYALRFEFPISNNEAEYEALIAGLELATRLEVTHLQVFSDSLLITNHVKGTYEAREDSMKHYLAKT
ncbi:reverse transcriptase domain-containing protein [Tanacetum coccineum]